MRTLIAASPLAKFNFEPWRTRMLNDITLLERPDEQFTLSIPTSYGDIKVNFGEPFVLSDLPMYRHRPSDAQHASDWLCGKLGPETDKYGIVEIDMPDQSLSLDALVFKRDNLQRMIKSMGGANHEDQKQYVEKLKIELKQVEEKLADRVNSKSSFAESIQKAQEKADEKVLKVLTNINRLNHAEKQRVSESGKGEFPLGVTELVASFVLKRQKEASKANGVDDENKMAKYLELEEA